MQIEQLDRGTILYEGNDFAAWCERINLSLQERGLLASTCEYPRDWEGVEKDPSQKDQCKLAVAKICTQVCQSILDRISLEDKALPSRLLKRLPVSCKPFMFLRLPERVRNRVYLEVITAETDLDRNIQEKRPRLPILEVSRRVRQEALTVYTSNMLFYFYEHEDDLAKKCRQQIIHATVLAWAKKELGGGQIQNLRRLSLCFRPIGMPGKRMFRDIDFQYSEEKGLEEKGLRYGISGAAKLSASSKDVLAKHVKKARCFSRMPSFKGQVLLQAVLLGSEIWERGVLEWEVPSNTAVGKM